MKPLISVVMPVHNAEKYLLPAIESVLSQTYKHFEFIIVDDHSTDSSWKIIREYARKDKRIKAFRNKKNLGVTKTLNKGLGKSKGVLIARMDADDIADNKRFEKQVYKIQQGCGVLGSNISLINKKGERVGARKYESEVRNRILFESPLAHPSVMFKKDLVGLYGTYDEQFSTGQDYDLWLRLWSQGVKFHVIQEELLKYRVHNMSVKETKTKKSLQNTIKIKQHAKKQYNIRLGLRGEIRLLIERTLSLLPAKVILRIFYLTRGLK